LPEVADDGVHLGLGADVDAAGGLVEDQEPGFVFSHFASITFCWLPPESLPTSSSHVGVRIARRLR
jgi:hypothetical protein